MNNLEKLVERMRHEVVAFTYEKKDGTMREARGTLDARLCPPTHGRQVPKREHLQTYYDVDKQQYRSFVKDNLKSIK